MSVSTHPGSNASGDPAPGLRGLISSVTTDLQTLTQGSVELAKAEMQGSGKAAGKLGAFVGVAIALLTGAGLMFLFMSAYILVALGLLPWVAFLIVGLVLTIIAAILLLLARRESQRIKPPKRAIANAQETLAALRGSGGF
jgi:hypothetical protein